jgi:hypothetical protein
MPGVADLDIVAGLRASFGSLEQELQRDRIQRMSRVPIPVKRVGNVKLDASGDNAGIDLEGPALGRVWHLRALRIGGLTFGTTATGTGELYVGGLPATQMAASRDFSLLEDEAPNLPIIAFYSEGEIVVNHGERITVVIVGGGDNQQYVATMRAMDYSLALAPEVVEQ